jgi:SAM-dependent methyltransferase
MRHRVPFDRVADRYDETRGGVDRGHQHAAVLAPWLRPGAPVLEVGVGTGLVAAALSERAVPVIGVDLSLPMLHRAAHRLAGRIAAADALALPVRAGSVGSVYFVHVLHLIPTMAEALAEAARVLAPDGRVLVICAAHGAADSEEAVLMEALRHQLSGERPDSPERVTAAAQSAGLTLVHSEELREHEPYTPAQIADRLEQRLWAWTWDVDEDSWREHAVPVVDRLRSMPDADRPRTGAGIRTLLVLGR